MCIKAIKPKGLQDILSENKSLTEEITYDEFQRGIKQNLDDGIDDAYKTYRELLKELNN